MKAEYTSHVVWTYHFPRNCFGWTLTRWTNSQVASTLNWNLSTFLRICSFLLLRIFRCKQCILGDLQKINLYSNPNQRANRPRIEILEPESQRANRPRIEIQKPPWIETLKSESQRANRPRIEFLKPPWIETLKPESQRANLPRIEILKPES